MAVTPTFMEIDKVLIEQEFAQNSFFIDNIFKNRFRNPYYKAFHLFITEVFPENYAQYITSYNRAIYLLDEEDQIITDTLIYLYKEKGLINLNDNDTSDYHLEELEKGYQFIVNQIKEY